MRGMNTSQLTAVVDFIYHGEVSTHEEELDDFLALADNLKLKGLKRPKTDKKEPVYVQRSFLQQNTLKDQTSRYTQESQELAVSIKTDPCDEPTKFNLENSEMRAKETFMVVHAETSVRTTTTSEELDETINYMIEKL